jgi:hypothetical protein
MSYCAIENTLSDLGVVQEVIDRLINDGDSINEYEQRCFSALLETMRTLVEQIDNAIDDGIIDENGALCNSDDDNDDDDGYDPDHAYEDMRSEEIIEKNPQHGE